MEKRKLLKIKGLMRLMTSLVRVILPLLLIINSSLITLAQVTFNNEQELIEQANKLFGAESYTEAKPLFSQLLSLHPGVADYNYKFGVCKLYTDADKNESLNYLEAAANIAGVSNDAFFYLGKGYHLNFRFDDAIAQYNKYKSGLKGDADTKDVDRHITMCKNGKQLFDPDFIFFPAEKNKTIEGEFFRKYDQRELKGKIIARTDNFKTKYDKKINDNSLMFVSQLSRELYFSGYGEEGATGSDIYRVYKLPNGEWALPQRLPDVINTGFDEAYAFMHPEGDTLYFSSKGHNTMGGYDIFMSVLDRESGTWSKPVNMRYPYSTPDDDIFYAVEFDREFSYFATRNFTEPGKMTVYKVSNSSDKDALGIISGKFSMGDTLLTKAQITLADKESGELVGIFNSNKVSGKYLLALPKGKVYTMNIEPEGFVAHKMEMKVPSKYEVPALNQKIAFSKTNEGEKVTLTNGFDGAGNLNEDVKTSMYSPEQLTAQATQQGKSVMSMAQFETYKKEKKEAAKAYLSTLAAAKPEQSEQVASAETKPNTEEKAKQEEIAKAEAAKKAEQEEKARLAAEQAKKEAEEKAKQEELAKAEAAKKAEQEEKARLAAEQAKKEAEEKAKQEEVAKAEAAKKAEQEEKARLAAEQAKKEAEEKTKQEEVAKAEAAKKVEQEEKARLAAEQAKKEAEEKAKQEEVAKAEATKKAEQEEKARLAAEQAKKEAEEKAKQEEVAKVEAAKKVEQEEKARLAAEQAKKEAEEKAKQEEVAKAEAAKKAEQEEKARLAAEQAKKEAEEKSKQEELAKAGEENYLEEKNKSDQEKIEEHKAEAEMKKAELAQKEKAEKERLAALEQKQQELANIKSVEEAALAKHKEKEAEANAKMKEEEKKDKEAVSKLEEDKKLKNKVDSLNATLTQGKEQKLEVSATQAKTEEQKRLEEQQVAEHLKALEEKKKQEQEAIAKQEAEHLAALKRQEEEKATAKKKEEEQKAKQLAEQEQLKKEMEAAEKAAEEARLVEEQAKKEADKKAKQEEITKAEAAKKAEQEKKARLAAEQAKKEAEEKAKKEELAKAEEEKYKQGAKERKKMEKELIADLKAKQEAEKTKENKEEVRVESKAAPEGFDPYNVVLEEPINMVELEAELMKIDEALAAVIAKEQQEENEALLKRINAEARSRMILQQEIADGADKNSERAKDVWENRVQASTKKEEVPQYFDKTDLRQHEGVHFKIELVLKSAGISELAQEKITASGEVFTPPVDEYVVHTTGYYKTLAEITIAKSELRDRGINDFRVIAYQNGEEIPLSSVKSIPFAN